MIDVVASLYTGDITELSVGGGKDEGMKWDQATLHWLSPTIPEVCEYYSEENYEQWIGI